MQVDLSAVADYANVAEGQKLNVCGIFDTIQATTFPARHPFMVFALRLRAEYEDSGKQVEIRISLEDEDGGRSLEVQGHIKVGELAPGGFGHVNQILALKDVTFGRPGQYTFRVTIDGKESKRHPITVLDVRNP